jgi:hypothetical protein
VAFEIHALILALHYEARFLRSPGSMQRAVRGFEGILGRFSNPSAPEAVKPKVAKPFSKSSPRTASN